MTRVHILFASMIISSTACAAFRGWTGNRSNSGSKSWGFASAAALDTAAETCVSPAQALGQNLDLLSTEQQALVASLLALNQEHLFSSWPALGEDDVKKVGLLEQLQAVDGAYPGGLGAYIGKARELLASAAAGDNPFEGYTPSVPSGEDLLYGDGEYQEMEALGLAAASRLGLVLVAGGLGERLGYSGIKVELPVDLAAERSFLATYAKWILGLQSRARISSGDPHLQVPLAIMTSGDTDGPTRALLEAEGYMGLDPTQVTVLMQDKVPALSDNAASLVTSKGDRWRLETKPHGHGDVHHLMHRSGLAQAWQDAGKDWVFFFQDTNPLVIHALVPMLGVSVDKRYDMNSLCVPRRAGEAAGGIAKLTHSDGHEITINVEYNQLDPLLRSTPGFEGGDVDDPHTNFSPFPGNVNNLLVHLPSYTRVIAGPDQGVVDEFVNPKYADASRTTFKKPTRLECMMQDLPKLLAKELGNEANVGFTTMERWLTFSPAKNDPGAGAAAAAAGSPPGSPASSEADVYGSYRAILAKATGATIEDGEGATFAGMPVTLLPAISLDPGFAATSSELAGKIIGDTRISGRSSLVVEGGGVVEVSGLQLDGALVIKCTVPGATLRVQGLAVVNRGWEFVPAEVGAQSDAEVPEVLRIRGFKLLKHETKVIEVTQPGQWAVRADGELVMAGE